METNANSRPLRIREILVCQAVTANILRRYTDDSGQSTSNSGQQLGRRVVGHRVGYAQKMDLRVSAESDGLVAFTTVRIII